jgi:hypothetical protein
LRDGADIAADSEEAEDLLQSFIHLAPAKQIELKCQSFVREERLLGQCNEKQLTFSDNDSVPQAIIQQFNLHQFPRSQLPSPEHFIAEKTSDSMFSYYRLQQF